MASPNFRAGVVTVVRNSSGLMLAFERSSPRGEWQLPQGGIDRHESPVEAAWRELGEETGLGRDEVSLAAEHPYWTIYHWPTGTQRKKGRLGQAHRWFFFDIHRDDIEPTPDGKEFVDWKWVEPTELLSMVVEFRREPYRQVLGENV